MFCGECGTQNPDTNAFCKNCGKPVRRPTVQGIAPGSGQPAGAAQSTPPAPGIVTAHVQDGHGPAPGFLATLKRRKAVVASIICGVVSALILPYVLGAFAIIIGIWAVYKKDVPGVIGIIIGSMVILVNYFYFVIFP